MNQNNNNCNVPKSISTNKVNYPMSNKMWFNQRVVIYIEQYM